MKRALKGAVFLGGFALGAWLVFRLFEGDVARIERVVLSAKSSFNSASVAGIRDALAESFRQNPENLGRNEVVLVLAHLFLTARDSKTREFQYQADLVGDTLTISIEDGEPKRASVAVEVEFQRVKEGAPEKTEAHVRFSGRMEKIDGAWKFTEAEAKRLSGKWPPF